MSGAPERLYIGLIGPGLVGSELLRQIHARFHGPRSQSSSSSSPLPSFSVALRFVATSKRMAFLRSASVEPEASLDLQKDWKTFLNGQEGEDDLEGGAGRGAAVGQTDIPSVLDGLRQASGRGRASVLVDCSASAQVPQLAYATALDLGISVVTPNKCFAAGPAPVYARALAAAAAKAASISRGADSPPAPVYLGEATVGAGLPVLSTLRDLIATGDRIKRIEGVFSGSLSFLFNALCKESGEGAVVKRGVEREGGAQVEGGAGGEGAAGESLTLASVVRRARDLGYTEPDPRDDLAGVDVARKAVILARAVSHAGANVGGASSAAAAAAEGGGGASSRNLIELSDVPVRSLVPENLSDRASVDVEAFLTGLESDDGGVGAEVSRARLEGKVLRYVGAVTVDDDGRVKAEVALRSFSREHPYAGLAGADNVFSFVTERYSESSPLVIRGPGAGAAVTAAGVFGDLLTVARAAGASV